MNRKFKLIYFIVSLHLVILSSSFAKINIITSVDNEIITNYDILKEDRYLRVLNPNLNNLTIKQITELAKQSLIKEIIKKKEISRFISLDQENLFVEEYLSNILIKLGYKDKKTFNDDLLNNETYSLEEVKLKIKIELFWNEIIFNRYNDQVVIDEKGLLKKINNQKNKERKEFFLSEIVFKKKRDEDIDDTIFKIKKSINEVGFDNTANMYSISESSKFGGKIGWLKEDTLSKKISAKINILEVNEYSDVIKLENNFVILKVDEIKITENKIDKKKEFQKILEIERNKKLEKFSIIYFNKIKRNYIINDK
jgi:peptidyl-prolyl cis-trans isomerase SurA